MPKPLIKDRQIIDDAWTLVRDAEAGAPAGPAILPLALWKTLRDSRAAADTGVWLAPADDPAELAGAVAELPVIAVDFPQFADGRGYSIGRLLRERYGFAGELLDQQRTVVTVAGECLPGDMAWRIVGLMLAQSGEVLLSVIAEQLTLLTAGDLLGEGGSAWAWIDHAL